MVYKVELLKRTKKSLIKLHPEIFSRISKALQELAYSPFPNNSKKLTGRDAYRLRIGDYRVIYEINEDEKLITILDVDHRSNIYRNDD